MSADRKLPSALFDHRRGDEESRMLPGALGRLAEDAQHTRDIASGVASLLRVLDWDADLLAYQGDTDPGDPFEPTIFNEYTRGTLMRFAIVAIEGLADRADRRLDAIRGGATYGHP